MKQIFATFYTLLISCLCLSLVFAGGMPGTMPNMPPMAFGEAGLIFHYEPDRHISKDIVSKGAWSQTYAGTNRTRINSAGLLETVGANTPAIDHIGASLEPYLRLEPAAANILLGTPPTTQDLTLPTGSFTLQVLGAGTAEAAANTATITGAGTASTGVPVTFVVTVAGAVTITITTATVVWLCPGAIPSSYFAGAAAIGAELVTDGGFDAVTESATLNTNTFTNNINPAWDYDNFSGASATGYTANTVSANGGYVGVEPSANFVGGKCYSIAYDLTINAGIAPSVRFSGGGASLLTLVAGVGQKQYFNTPASGVLYISHAPGETANYVLANVVIKEVTFTNWTAGTEWAPQATAGALTGKVSKIAGTASALTQTTTPAEAGSVYRVGHTAIRTAGTYTAEFGSTNGTAVAANGLYYDYIIAADTDYIKFNADATFAGSIDLATGKKHGTVRLSEANTTTLAIPPDVAAALAAKGTIVIKGRFAFARAAGVITNILASAAATASLVYTTTAAGNITSNDGTTIAENTGAYTANTDWKIALKFPSDTDKYRIGIDVAGAGIAWGTEVAFDGAFTATANLILGYVLHGATHIKYIKFYDKVLTDAQINAQ